MIEETLLFKIAIEFASSQPLACPAEPLAIWRHHPRNAGMSPLLLDPAVSMDDYHVPRAMGLLLCLS
jgi:hypothetical protein